MLSPSSPVTRETVAALDCEDPLAELRRLFELPAGIRYFDGNSLGPPLTASRESLIKTIEHQWGRDLIKSWDQHGWIDLPRRVGGRIARLIGAAPEEVVVADSTSVNLFKLLAAAVVKAPERAVILTESSQFPTDLYMAQGLASLHPAVQLRQVERHELTAALDHDVAVLCLSHVDFNTGERHDMAALTRAAHEQGALILWDLSHSTGAMEVELSTCDVDLAVGCTYKFLNGGPGAPAYVYVARRLQQVAQSPLWGWLGHRDPFAFDSTYEPAPNIDRFQCGTPPILSLAALDTALDVFDTVDLTQVRSKSTALGELFLNLVEQECPGYGLSIACPADAEARGSQVCLRHDHGYQIIQALIARGIVGDFRPPDVLRFGLTPLYMRFADVWDAVESLREILKSRTWDDPRFDRQGKVT